jgi:hypothetical protein
VDPALALTPQWAAVVSWLPDPAHAWPVETVALLPLWAGLPPEADTGWTWIEPGGGDGLAAIAWTLLSARATPTRTKARLTGLDIFLYLRFVGL